MAKNKKILIIISAIFIISLITAADILLKSYFTKQQKEKLEAQQIIDTIKPEIIGDIDTNKVGEYEITYTATDRSNNKAEQTIRIKIEPKEPTQEAANESNQIPKEQSQSTTNNSASTTSKQPNTPPTKESKESKNNSSNNTKRNQSSSSTKSKGSTSINDNKMRKRQIGGVDSREGHYGEYFNFSSKQLDELGL